MTPASEMVFKFNCIMLVETRIRILYFSCLWSGLFVLPCSPPAYPYTTCHDGNIGAKDSLQCQQFHSSFLKLLYTTWHASA